MIGYNAQRHNTGFLLCADNSYYSSKNKNGGKAWVFFLIYDTALARTAPSVWTFTSVPAVKEHDEASSLSLSPPSLCALPRTDRMVSSTGYAITTNASSKNIHQIERGASPSPASSEKPTVGCPALTHTQHTNPTTKIV